jgi:high-affinity iron transporter
MFPTLSLVLAVGWALPAGCAPSPDRGAPSDNPIARSRISETGAAGTADRLLARLAYVRADYAHAVAADRVLDPEEYEEQRALLREVLVAAEPLPLAVPTRTLLGSVAAAVSRGAPPAEVEAAIDAVVARARVELAAHLTTPDTSRLDAGPALYARHCASCHGPHGEGPPSDAAFTPPPPALAAPGFAARLSPRRVWEAVTFGIPGTAMVGHAESLTDAERWALAWHVVRLPIPAEPSPR